MHKSSHLIFIAFYFFFKISTIVSWTLSETMIADTTFSHKFVRVQLRLHSIKVFMKFDDILILFKIFRLKDSLLFSQSSNNMIDFFWPCLASHHKSFILILDGLINLSLELRDSLFKELQFSAHIVFVSIRTADLCN